MNVYWLEQAEADVPTGDAWLAASEFLHLSRFHVPKRRADWRLGRWTAKRAIAIYLQIPQDNESLQDIEILSDSSGAPCAYLKKTAPTLSISITHRAGVAACAVAPFDASVGCDLELIEAHSDAFVADYFTSKEQAMIAQASADERDKLVTTMWSAKESALKALRLGLRADTRSVAVNLRHGWPISAVGSHALERQSFLPTNPTEEWCPLKARYKEDQGLFGWWQCSGKLTRTVVGFHAMNPPILLTAQS